MSPGGTVAGLTTDPLTKRPRTLVTFLPGIMGSALKRGEGKKERWIWSDRFAQLLRSIIQYGDLTCYPEDPDTVTPTHPLGRVSTFFVTLFQGYDRLVDHLGSHGFKDSSLLLWPYDWRQSIATLALKFLEDLRVKQSESGFERLVIIGHSEGCLVARLALSLDLRGAKRWATKQTRLVEITPPFDGAPASLAALHRDPLEALGMFRYLTPLLLGHADPAAWLIYHRMRSGLQRAISSFASIYDLMPPDKRIVVFSEAEDRQFTTEGWLTTMGQAASLREALQQRQCMDSAAPSLATALDRVERVVLERPRGTPYTLSCKKRPVTHDWVITGTADRGAGDQTVPSESAHRWSPGAEITVLDGETYAHNSVPIAPRTLEVVTRAVTWP